MKAYLFDSHMVEIDPRSAEIGGSFQARKNGLPAAWDEKTLKLFYEAMLEKGHVEVIDIGANTGSFTLLAALHPDMRVVAFEPNTEAYDLLSENCKLNGLQDDRVKLYQSGLWEPTSYTAVTLNLRVPKNRQSGLSTFATHPQRFTDHEVYSALVMVLDDLMLPADFIKIDTEGSELAILKGGERTIRDWRPKMLIEYYAPNTRQFGYEPSDITDLLEGWGASWKRVSNEDIWVWWA